MPSVKSGAPGTRAPLLPSQLPAPAVPWSAPSRFKRLLPQHSTRRAKANRPPCSERLPARAGRSVGLQGPPHGGTGDHIKLKRQVVQHLEAFPPWAAPPSSCGCCPFLRCFYGEQVENGGRAPRLGPCSGLGRKSGGVSTSSPTHCGEAYKESQPDRAFSAFNAL